MSKSGRLDRKERKRREKERVKKKQPRMGSVTQSMAGGCVCMYKVLEGKVVYFHSLGLGSLVVRQVWFSPRRSIA